METEEKKDNWTLVKNSKKSKMSGRKKEDGKTKAVKDETKAPELPDGDWVEGAWLALRQED